MSVLQTIMPDSNGLQQKFPYYIAYGYFTFLSIGESCLIPFLTLYFKHLGLTPLQVGFLRSSFAFIGIFTSVLWTTLAARHNKQQLIIAVSITISIFTYAVLMFVPPVAETKFHTECSSTNQDLVRSVKPCDNSKMVVTSTRRNILQKINEIRVLQTSDKLQTKKTAKLNDETSKNKMNGSDQQNQKKPKSVPNHSTISPVFYSKHKIHEMRKRRNLTRINKRFEESLVQKKNAVNESLKPRNTKKKALYYQVYSHASFNPVNRLQFQNHLNEWDDKKETSSRNVGDNSSEKRGLRKNNENSNQNDNTETDSEVTAKKGINTGSLFNENSQKDIKMNSDGVFSNENNMVLSSNSQADIDLPKLSNLNEWNDISSKSDSLPYRNEQENYKPLYGNNYNYYMKYSDYTGSIPLNLYRHKLVSKRNSGAYPYKRFDYQIPRDAANGSEKLLQNNGKGNFVKMSARKTNDIPKAQDQAWRKRLITMYKMPLSEYQPAVDAIGDLVPKDMNYQQRCDECYDLLPSETSDDIQMSPKKELDKSDESLVEKNVFEDESAESDKHFVRKENSKVKLDNETQLVNHPIGKFKRTNRLPENNEETVKNQFQIETTDFLHLFNFLPPKEISTKNDKNNSMKVNSSEIAKEVPISDTFTLNNTLTTTTTAYNLPTSRVFPHKPEGNQKNICFFVLYACSFLIGIFGTASYATASATWYDYLDGIDEIENFEGHRSASLLLSAVITFLLGVIIVQSPCRMWPAVDLYPFHVIMYTIFTGCALFLLIFFSQLNKKKTNLTYPLQYLKRIFHLFSGGNVTVVSVSVLLSAAWTASVQDFLIWTIEDMGGNGYHFGGIVAVGLMFELLAPNILKVLFKKMTLQKCLVLLSFLQTFQLFYFSLLWAPGVVFVGQVLSGCFIGIKRIALDVVLSQTHPALNYQVRVTINEILCGVGFTIGSLLGGFLYKSPGGWSMYRTEGIVALIWSFILVIMCRFWSRNLQDNYEELQNQDPIDRAAALSVVESDTDDDWLEEAIKKNTGATQSTGDNFSIQIPELHPPNDDE